MKSETMNPLSFEQLINWMENERASHGTVFGVSACYKAKKAPFTLGREKLETPVGPAAGPNTQLAQNIIAAYYAGARFFELKTVQPLDGDDLAKCIGRPCITAGDEGYNCEWSTELTVKQAFAEYVKAWVAIKYFSKKWKLGTKNGFMFNMSVGYSLPNLMTDKLNAFIDGMKDASDTEEFKACIDALAALYPEDEKYIRGISPKLVQGVTISTLHGCPPGDIEAMAEYLIKEKKLNTYVKCNPTILGYDFCRDVLDSLGYSYIRFGRLHFEEDLQYEDAVPMFRRLLALAEKKKLLFGLKLSNTFPVSVTRGELPSEEMYMSGRSLYPLTTEMAARLSRDIGGSLRLSFSGGADAFNIEELVKAGIWPVTVATTILKPGGCGRFKQIAEELENGEYSEFSGVDAKAAARIARSARMDERCKKAEKPSPSHKISGKLPLFDCFTAPCTHGCPIGQDAPEYMELCSKGLYEKALRLILAKNPLPFITGTICAHHCMDKCVRNFYDKPVDIRGKKLEAAEKAYDAVIDGIKPVKPGKADKTAVIGGGPAGMAAAYFLARQGVPVTLFEKSNSLGGVVRRVIPEFRIADAAIDKDEALIRAIGADIKTGTPAPSKAELVRRGYKHIIIAVGAEKQGRLDIEGNVINALDMMADLKANRKVALGNSVAVIGGGNTAMDAARAAKRGGAENVYIVYRRTKKEMPADGEELELAMAEGVEFRELLSPWYQRDGKLLCRVMRLGKADASGRRRPMDTGEVCELPCDTVIAAVGEKVDGSVLDAYCSDASIVIGDAKRGPATVAEAIADALAAVESICGKYDYDIPGEAIPEDAAIVSEKARICRADGPCLGCAHICENCVTACPNRANVEITANGRRQILHIDRLCNECGNCAVFCPYDGGRPYKDKLTLFANEESFACSDNNGFIVKSVGKVKIRMDGLTETCAIDGGKLDRDTKAVVKAVIGDYGYLLSDKE